VLWLVSGLSTVFNMVQEFGTAVLRIAANFYHAVLTSARWENVHKPVRRNTVPSTPAAPANSMKLHPGSLFTNPNSTHKRICDIWTWRRLLRSPARTAPTLSLLYGR